MFFKGVFVTLLVGIVCVQCATVEEEVQNSTAFTLDLYRSLSDDYENTVVSPLSFRIIFSLIYQTTFGKSFDELQEHLYFGNKNETSASQRLTLDKLSKSPNLKVVNKVYLKEGFNLTSDFNYLVDQYKSAVEQVDFLEKRKTADKINQWVEEQTNKIIKNLVSEKIFDQDTALMILNTMYFKAKWLEPFPTTQVYARDFFADDGKNYTTDFMIDISMRSTFKYPEIKAHILELPYEVGSNTKFWLILPNDDSNITEVKNLLSYDVFKNISDNLKVADWTVQIPLFDIETDIDGIKELRKLGIHKIFDDFEIKILEGDNNLKVDGAKQKTKIIVNTEGTEAATSSYSKATTRSGRPAFRANKPFIYIILTADTNEPLFIGHYSKPNGV